MKKGDIVLLILTFVLLAGVVVMILLKPSAGYANVYVNGELYGSYPLNTDTTQKIVTKDGYNILSVKEGKAQIIEADCKNQVCVHTLSIDKIGDSIICLPHKVSVILEKQ